VDEPWIPVTLAADFPGRAEREQPPRVSLREAFAHGDCILDLRCYPHERIALMRLLICIAQRALNGPANEEEWQVCRADFAAKTVAYLEEYRHCFNLFGDGPRFLQAHGKGKPGHQPVFRLGMIDKNTPALFDAHARPGGKVVAEDLAVALVTYQSFAAGGKTGGSEFSESKGRKEPQGGEHALCRDGAAAHSFLLGDSLVETVWWNLVTPDCIPAPMRWTQDSRPVWEVRGSGIGDFGETELKREYLGRLVPLSRAIWLDERFQSVELASGLRYGVFSDSKDQKTKRVKPGTYIREVSAAIQTDNRKDTRPRLVSASAGGVPKGVWRELHAIAVLGRSEKRGGPVALEHLRSCPGDELRLWCGALVGDQAKVVDTVESVFRLPAQFLEDVDAVEADDPKRHPGPNRTYRQGVGLAEQWSGRLRDAVKEYRTRLQDKKAAIQAHAAARYWTALEQKAEPVLLHAVAVGQEGFDADDPLWMSKSPWGIEVKRAALDAYEFACPHATPKQLRAYAAGLTALFGETKRPPSSEAHDAETEPSSEEQS
jgi:CRISPR system Cascade subunit CasA